MHSLIPYEQGFIVAADNGKLIHWDGTSSTELGDSSDYATPIQHAFHSERVLMVNGTMTPAYFNGALVSLNFTSGITGETALIGVMTFKGRAIYWKDEPGFYFAEAGSLQGDMSYFDLSDFSDGNVKTIFTYSTDAGDGTDDMLVCLMDSGDALMYQGSDPGDAEDWELIGKYSMPPPLSIRGDCGLNGDRVVLTEQGWINFDHVVKHGNVPGGIGHKIIGLAREAVDNGTNTDFWEAHYISAKGLLVITTESAGPTFKQHVMNVRTGAWCTFSGIDSKVWCVRDGHGYWATTTKIHWYNGYDDTVTTDALPAYTQLGSDGLQRQLTAIAPVLNGDQSKIGINAAAGFITPSAPSVSDDTVDSDPTRAWHSKNIFDHVVSYRMRYQSTGFERRWYSTQFLFKQGGPV